ncbi:carbohydrate binding family 9 domain-containing protein [bacterium]|nr:carbohydrate binding family 9 domain-containing protein [bacterium]
MRRILILILIFSGIGRTQVRDSVISYFTDKAPKIDGLVVENIWQKAALIDQFIQRQPDTGQPMTEKTEFFVAYDRQNIYFAFKCWDDPTKITAKELARDANLRYDDKLQIIIDTFLDRRNAYWFQINPRGSIGDALVSQNGSKFNKSWDGLWEGKAHITDYGYEGEIAIPFKTLSFRAGQTTWGFKIIRQISRKNETGYWPVANLDTYTFQVSDAGDLTGLMDLSQGIGLDVIPYGLVGADNKEDQKTSAVGDVGLDAFYQITSGIKAALTINTDFAQTEVDDRRVNLTRFPLFFEEKRDFFLDGSGYYNFGLEGNSSYARALIPFFSRRIGLDSEGNPVPIIGGLKVTGQAGAWNFGLLNITDNSEKGRNNYTIARVSRNLGGQSFLGVIGTNGNSLGDENNNLIGVDLKLGTSTFLGNKNLSGVLFGLKSNTTGINNSDYAYGFTASYPNDFLFLTGGFHEIGENFHAGIGFVPRTGIRQAYFTGGIGPRPKDYGILQINSGVQIDYTTGLRNELLTRELGILPFEIELISGDKLRIAASNSYELLKNDFDIQPDHTIPAGIYSFNRFYAEAESAKRRDFWASINFGTGEFFNGNRDEYSVAISYKVAVPLYLGMQYDYNHVTLPDGSFDTKVSRLNIDILFNTDIFLYNYIQYDNISKNLGWQSRFVWILSPGKELFFVWKSVSYDPYERFEITENFVRLKFKYTFRF